MSHDAEVITAIEQDLVKAWLTGDREFIENILALEWSVTDPTGSVQTKQQVIDDTFGSHKRQIDAMVVDDVKVRVFGDAAVATGRTRASGSHGGQAVSVVLRFTDVFIRRGGRWQVVASHACGVAS